MTQVDYEQSLQDIRDFAVQYVCDEETADALIAEARNPYSDVFLMSAEEWDAIEDPEAEFLTCYVGQDVALDMYLVGRF